MDNEFGKKLNQHKTQLDKGIITKAVQTIGTAVSILILICVIIYYIQLLFQVERGPTTIYLVTLIIVTIISEAKALKLLVVLLPIVPAVHIQFSSIITPAVPFFVAYPGIDMIMGYLIGAALNKLYENRKLNYWIDPVPWPIALSLIVILVSTVSAIYRNLYVEGVNISVWHFIRIITHFKEIGQENPFSPYNDLVIYCIGALLIGSIITRLKSKAITENGLVRALALSLCISAFWGLVQATTKLGLPPTTYNHRAGALTYGAHGFQPDLHAFGALMLVGVIGLIGYFYQEPRREYKKLIGIAIAMCWLALFLSKSRSSIFLGLLSFAILVILSIAILPNKNRLCRVAALTISISLVLVITLPFILSSKTTQMIFPGIYIPYERINEILSLRPELHRAAIRMYIDFPIFGVGQGNFSRHVGSKLYEYADYAIISKRENAHNYVLQVLAEIGTIGFVSVGFALLCPLLATTNNRKALIAPYMLLASIVLGNIYSHSLIVRENLIMLFITVAVIYSKYNWRHR